MLIIDGRQATDSIATIDFVAVFDQLVKCVNELLMSIHALIQLVLRKYKLTKQMQCQLFPCSIEIRTLSI